MSTQETMQQSINDIIKQNLPAAVGEQLQRELTRLYEIEKSAAKTKKDLDEYLQIGVDLKAEVGQLKSANKILQDELDRLRAKAEEVQLREIKLNESILQAKLDAANSSNSSLLQLTQTIFRSPIAKRQVFEYTLPYTDAAGRYVSNPPSKTTTTTESEEPSEI